MTLRSGERQVAPTLDGIRRDHRARYEFAAARLPPRSRVLDLACGVGYGAKILADAGHVVLAIDRDAKAIGYAHDHYHHDEVRFQVGNLLATPGLDFRGYDAAVCFEAIEHLADPLPLLCQLSQTVPYLICSVPNERVFPYSGQAFHHRHYTLDELQSLLRQAGWLVDDVYGQRGTEDTVEPAVNGRTIVVVAHSLDTAPRSQPDTAAAAPQKGSPAPPAPAPLEPPALPPPADHVAIVALGPSSDDYVRMIKYLGGRQRLADQVWVVNALGDLLKADLIFHMDDVRIQEIRAAAQPAGNIAPMLEWMKAHPGPIMTSRAHPDYPGLVEFPLAAVMDDLGCEPYFNGTGAYAVAYAIYRRVKKLSLFGFDFTYANAHHAERGRACVEFLLGIAWARGIEVALPETTPLMDFCEPLERRLYGYDSYDLAWVDAGDGSTLQMTLRDTLPTAEEIEARYDHRRHPNPLVAAASTKRSARQGGNHGEKP